MFFYTSNRSKMVFPKLVITIVLILVLLFFYESEGSSYSSSSHFDGHGSDINASIAYHKVNLSVYYDSLCKSCAVFIVRDLSDIFPNNLINILNLHLVPWTNATFDNKNSSISCQSGPDECELNSLASCALNTWNNVNIQYELVNCLELLTISGEIDQWKEKCLDTLGLPKERFLNCFNTGNGTELGKAYINQIAQLRPRPSFLPWVVVNNQPLGNDYANFTYYVCKAYKGFDASKVCNPSLK